MSRLVSPACAGEFHASCGGHDCDCECHAADPWATFRTVIVWWVFIGACLGWAGLIYLLTGI